MSETEIKISLHDYFKNGSILIVDDMTNMRRTIKSILRHLGLDEKQILQADDGDTALKILKNETQNIIFVLLDWNMPRVTGIEVLKEMKEDKKLRNIPVLMITAETNENQIAQAVENEVKNYIIKPFVATTLQEKMLNILNPPEYLQLLKKGEDILDLGKYDEALSIFETVLKIRPNSSSVRILMGKAYEKMNENKEATKLYEEAIEKNPQYLRAFNTFADFLLKTGDKKKALIELEKAAELSPLNSNRQIKIGDLVLETGENIEKAEHAFEAAMKQSPESAKEVAEIYLKNGKAEEAEKLFRTALKRTVNIHLYNRLGIALRHQKKWQEAVVEYQKALKVEPRNDTIFHNMGMAYLDGGKTKEAMQNFKSALEINPNFADPKIMLQKLQKAA